MGNNLCSSAKNTRIISHDNLDTLETLKFAIDNLETQRLMKLKEIKEINCCGICLNNPYEIAFIPCGHIICRNCDTGASFTNCPFCRANIENKLILYFN